MVWLQGLSRFMLWSATVVLLTASCAPAAAPASTSAPTAAPAKPAEAAAPKAAPPTVPVIAAPAKPTPTGAQAKLDEYYQKAKAANELKIVHYGPGPEYQPMVDAFRKIYPDVQIELVNLRGTETFQRISAEMASGRHIGNVVSGGQTTQTAIEEQGFLEVWEGPPNAADLPSTTPPSKGGRWAITYNVFGFIVNTSLVPADKLPVKRQDLLDPRWKGKGKILFEDPRAGGPGIDFFTITYDELGQEYLDKIKAQEPTFVRDRDAAPAQIARGEYDGFFPLAVNTEMFELEKAAPVKLGWFRDGGTTIGQNGIGIIKESFGQDVAKLWISWFCSAEGQRVMAEQSKIYAALPGTPPPPGFPRLEDLNPQRRSADQIIRANDYGAIFNKTFFE